MSDYFLNFLSVRAESASNLVRFVIDFDYKFITQKIHEITTAKIYCRSR